MPPKKDPSLRAAMGGFANDLLWASRNGDINAMKEAIRVGDDVNGTGKAGVLTPLHHVCALSLSSHPRERKQELIRYLLSEGADVNRRAGGDSSGSTPILAMAHAVHNFDEFDVLVDNGADPLVTDRLGVTMLHIMCMSNRSLAVVRAAVKALPSLLNAQTLPIDSCRTPLHYAARYSSLEVVRHLVLSGANLFCRTEPPLFSPGTRKGHTPEYIAESNLRRDVATWLRVYKEDMIPKFYALVIAQRLEFPRKAALNTRCENQLVVERNYSYVEDAGDLAVLNSDLLRHIASQFGDMCRVDDTAQRAMVNAQDDEESSLPSSAIPLEDDSAAAFDDIDDEDPTDDDDDDNDNDNGDAV